MITTMGVRLMLYSKEKGEGCAGLAGRMVWGRWLSGRLGGWAGNGIQQGTFTLGSVGGIIGHHMRPFMKYLNMSGHCQQCFPAEFT